MTDITKQTEDELRATITSAQARLKEIEDSKKKTFAGNIYELHVEEGRSSVMFAIHDRKTGVLKSDIHKLIVWLGERLGGQAPQEPCEVCKVLELGPALKPIPGRIYLGAWKDRVFLSETNKKGEIFVHAFGWQPFEECTNVREVRLKQ